MYSLKSKDSLMHTKIEAICNRAMNGKKLFKAMLYVVFFDFFSHVDTFQNLPQLWTEVAYFILKIYCTKMQSVGYWTCNNFWAHYFWHFGPYVSWHKVEHKIALINIVLTRYQQESLDTSLNLSVLVGPCKIIYPGRLC